MNETVLFVVVALQTLLLIGLLVALNKRKDESATGLIKQDLVNLGKDIEHLREGLSDKLTERLDKSQRLMVDSIRKQFSESSKLIGTVTKDLTELKESNKQVVSVTDELKTLQNILQNPKQRGVLGEYHLQTVLENVLPPKRFTMQYRFKDGETVDAAIHLDKKRILPVDSKFSLENYNRMVEEKDKTKRQAYAKSFKLDLKNRIDETAKYIRPNEGTLDHAFMFIPSEAIYYDLLSNKIGMADTSSRDLIEYAFRDKHVIIVSPTTFMAYLQTVMQGLRSLQIEEKAKEIQRQVGNLARHIKSYEVFMQKLGKSLGVSVSHFNRAHKELGKVDKDVVRIAEGKTNVEPLQLEKPKQDDN